MTLQAVTFSTKPIVQAHLIINCILVSVAVVVVGLRLISRFASGAKLWWDDFLILFSMPQGVAMLIIQGLYSPMGVGYPITETLPNLVTILKLTFAYALIYTVCISTVKLSVLCFYLRVFITDSMRLATKITIAFVSVWSIANILILLLICRPVAKNYDPFVEGTCGDQPSAFISIGAYNIISDVLILSLPIRSVWALNTKWQMKIALTAIFMAGLIVSVVSIFRILALQRLEFTNVTGTMVWVDFLSAAEVNLAILCVSLPMLGPLCARYRRRRGDSKLGKYHNSESGRSKQSGSKQSSRKNKKKTEDDTIVLESIYAHNMETHYETTVSVGGNDDSYRSSGDGSGTNISFALRTSMGDTRAGPGGIVVQNEWQIQHF